jgi:hypothetical protein
MNLIRGSCKGWQYRTARFVDGILAGRVGFKQSPNFVLT